MYLFRNDKRLLMMLIFSVAFMGWAHTSEAAPSRDYDAVVYTSNHNRYKGFLEDVSEKGITIDYFGQHKFIHADSIRQIKIKRSNALKSHALAGAAAGLAIGIPVYLKGNSTGKLSLLALPVVLIGGTLSGAVLGSLVNTVTHVKRFSIQKSTSFKSIYPILLRYSAASPSRKAKI